MVREAQQHSQLKWVIHTIQRYTDRGPTTLSAKGGNTIQRYTDRGRNRKHLETEEQGEKGRKRKL